MQLLTRFTITASLIAGITAATAGPVAGQGTWETTLKARDISGNAVALESASAAFFYDTTTNVTWLADMNLSGVMNGTSATAWADALTIGGFSDWRLPHVYSGGPILCDTSYGGGTDCGYNVLTQLGSNYSEWAHLFYVTLGNKGYCPPSALRYSACPQPGYGMSNSAYFGEVQRSYWTGTGTGGEDSGGQFFFDANGGYQSWDWSFTGAHSAAALRTGDVLREANAVPEPQSLALALAALAGMGVALRRRPCC